MTWLPQGRIGGVLAALALLSLPAGAGEAPLALQGSGAYYTLKLPLAVQSQASAADLHDLQVVNARGEAIPFAWAEETRSDQAEEQRQGVPFFEAPQAASAVGAAQQGGWIIDVRAVKGAMLDLQLELPATTHGVYSYVLEASNDLQQWRTVNTEVQLLSLQHQGLRLDSSPIELDGLHARYLRLRPQPGSLQAPVSAAVVTSITHFSAPPAWQWSDPIAASQCKPQACDYALPHNLPLERVDLVLTEANVLAPVQFLGEYDARYASTVSEPRHHHLRHHLRGLHRKTAPPAADNSPAWRTLEDSTAYWLRLAEGEVRSRPIEMDGGLYRQLRVQPGGGMTQLGTHAPALRIGYRPRLLVFLARGPAPYALRWGDALNVSAALPLTQLMPTRQAGDALPEAVATVVLPPPLAASATTATSATAAPASVAQRPEPAAPARKQWLWAVLLIALGLMGWMAWSLLRPTAKT